MEKCAKFLIDEAGNVKQILEQISCEQTVRTVTEYPNWFMWGGGVLLVFIAWSLVGYPLWSIWASRKSGLASLAEAENEEKVAIAKANARIGAAEANKRAEIVEAEAVSESIKTIGEALEKNQSYNRFQWIKMMENRPDSSVIYVPTEANLPILEAGNRKNKVEVAD